MSFIYLPKDASKAQLRAAENARKNRAEILKAYSQGKVSRRELIKWGLITSAGAIAPIAGLSPFVPSVHASGAAVAAVVVAAAMSAAASHWRTAQPAFRRAAIQHADAPF